MHDIQIAGTTIYRIVKSQYKQVAGGSGGSQNAKAGIGSALHLLGLVLPPIKIPREMVLCERNNQVGAASSQ